MTIQEMVGILDQERANLQGVIDHIENLPISNLELARANLKRVAAALMQLIQK